MKRPQLMAILNVTPDSFSGDGTTKNSSVLKKFITFVEAGADIVDIGAESTRPGATALSAEEEWERLQPALTVIATHPLRKHIRLSIDTRHAATAKGALALGVDIINDVSGLREEAIRALLAKQDCAIVVMHSLTIPADKNVLLPPDADPVAVVLDWKRQAQRLAGQSGIAAERLIFDPGIGFGKSAEQSLALIERAAELVQSGGSWLYGHSRKSFLTQFADVPAAGRDALTLGYSAKLAAAGAQYLRVHDVAAHRRFFAEAA